MMMWMFRMMLCCRGDIDEKVQASGSKEGGERLPEGAQGGGGVEGRGGVRQGAPHHLQHRLQDDSNQGF